MPKSLSRTRLAAAFAASFCAVAPAVAQDGVAGAYLAARLASMESDYAAAAEYYTKALIRDPGNPALLEGAVVGQIALGRLDAALPVARRLREIAPQSQVAELVLLSDQLVRGDFEAALADFDAGRETGPLVDGLVRAWALLGTGDVSAALEAFDAVSQAPALAPFGIYHKALALASVGDFEGADRLFSGEEGQKLRLTRRGVIAHAETLGQLERFDEAVAKLDEAFGADPDPAVTALRDRLENGEVPPFDLVTSPASGLAEVFYSVAGVLNGEAEDSFVLIYSRVAEALSPSHTDAILLSASILERQRQYDLATATYARIPRDNPAFHLAELGRAEALQKAGRTEAAIEALEQLARSHGALPAVHRALGDALRREERYEEAVLAYDDAIAALPNENSSHWVLYYVRGISHERLDHWEQAEADFRKALEFEPDQPQVLNYLGYSFLEKKTNLEEALDMIERAVAARPDDGYIIDSLAWGLFRLGRYDEALPHMERASELMPTDPVVTDHLGDVYWAVGRRLEAQFQWRRALSYATTNTDAQDFEPDRVRRKLEVGLDAVLLEEGEPPLIQVANDG